MSTYETGFWQRDYELNRLISEIYANTGPEENKQDQAVVRDDVIKLSRVAKGAFMSLLIGSIISILAFMFEITHFIYKWII